MPSLIIRMAFFYTHVERERSKIVLAHASFSPPATLPTLSIWAYVMHVILDPRLPLFSRVR